MLLDFAKSYSDQIASLQLLLLLINVLIHVIFAGAVAKDSGKLTATGQRPILVSGISWAFATVIGGVFIAAVYWLIHHSKLTRN